MDIAEKKALLKTIDLLSFFHETTLERLIEESLEVSLEPGEVLFDRGDPGGSMYLVLSGEILIFKKDVDITLMGPGSFFGEMALIEGQPRSAGAKALVPALLLEINENQFQNYFAAQPQVLMAIMKTMSARFRGISQDQGKAPTRYDSTGKPVLYPDRASTNHSANTLIFDPKTLVLQKVGPQVNTDLGITSDFEGKGSILELMPQLDSNSIQTWIRPLLNKTRPLAIFETSLKRRDGSVFPAEVRLALAGQEPETSGIEVRFRNITDQRHMEEAIRQMAYYDSLTGLPNRNLLNDRLAVALARAKRNQERISIMFLDLDHFKSVNDTLGHEAGDHLLREVAYRLTNILRKEDTIARLGGDEFIVVAPEIRTDRDASTLAEKILKQFEKPILLQDHELFVGCSIGISMFPEDGEDVKNLLKNADLALYRAKDLGRNNFQMYTAALNVKAMERMAIEKNLRKALERDEFSLVYQPRVNLKTGEITGVETLARWNNSELDQVTPAEFIPVAEETRQIVDLGHWILIHACRQLREWQNAGFTSLSIAVNLSPVQFSHPSLIRDIQEALQETGIPPHKLEMEITETTLMKDTDHAISILNQIGDLGIRVAIDDFGTGYSSLNYLKTLPIHFLKIDQTFIQDLAENTNLAITKTIVALGQSLELRTIAEGVETPEQKEILKSIECDEAQGFYFSKPLSGEKMLALLQSGKKPGN